jgi:hypothetical protein
MPRRYESCKNGHRRTEANTYFYKPGKPICRICRRINDRRRRNCQKQNPTHIYNFTQYIKRERMLHLHWVNKGGKKAGECYWRVMTAKSVICNDDARCLRLPIRS